MRSGGDLNDNNRQDPKPCQLKILISGKLITVISLEPKMIPPRGCKITVSFAVISQVHQLIIVTAKYHLTIKVVIALIGSVI